MTGLCGWFGRASAGESLSAMVAALNRFHTAPAHCAASRFGAVAALALGKGADAAQNEDVLAAVWGHARFTDAELEKLAGERGIAHALARGWAQRKTGIFGVLSGSFAIAILDGRSSEAALAVDRMGTRPLCYSATPEQLVFGSTLDAIGAFPGMRSQINRQAIYDYVYFHMIPGPRTIYEGRQRLAPGHFLLWRNGTIESQPYWKMRFIEDERRPFAELKESFLHVVRESVREAATDGRVGTFLSGGTDSSTIAGMLGEVTGEPARTYSIGFAAQGYDEMDYARIAARHFGTNHHEYYVTPDDVASAIPKIAAVHDQPFGNSSAVPTYYCARLARDDGVETLLGGDGGDELFGGNARYGHQYLLSLYSDLPEALRKSLIEPVAFLLPGIGILGKAQRYIRYASTPMPARYDNYNLIERLGAANVFTREFLDAVDPGLPAQDVAVTYRESNAASLINLMLALDFKYTLADNDLPKVARSCELAGVDIRFPLLSDAVVAFSASLAPNLKLKRTRLRYFFKEALRGFLPDAILTKSKHGFGLPFGPWLQNHKSLRQLVLDSLAHLKKRHLVQARFIDELTSVRIGEHAEYYGNMAWILVMLEHWLAERKIWE